MFLAFFSPFQSVFSDLTLNEGDFLTGQISSVCGTRQDGFPAEGPSAAFDVRGKLLHTENAFLSFGKMHLFGGEYHESLYLDPLQSAVFFQDPLQRPYVTFILKDRGSEANDLVFIKLDPFLFVDLNSSVVAFGFDDEQSPFANEYVVQLSRSASALQIYVVQYGGAGKFSLQGFRDRLLGFVSKVQDLSATNGFSDDPNRKSEKHGKING